MLKYEIKEHIAVLREYRNGKKELTLTSWNDQPPKYDVRIWNEDGTPNKGITLDADEMTALVDAIHEHDKKG